MSRVAGVKESQVTCPVLTAPTVLMDTWESERNGKQGGLMRDLRLRIPVFHQPPCTRYQRAHRKDWRCLSLKCMSTSCLFPFQNAYVPVKNSASGLCPDIWGNQIPLGREGTGKQREEIDCKELSSRTVGSCKVP